jgi:hypothetical protein
MTLTQRQEFASGIEQHDGNDQDLIDVLKKKVH